MSGRSRPAWLQALGTLILTGCASGIGMGLGETIQSNPASATALWTGALAAPLALVVAVGFWRSGRYSAWVCLGSTAAIYVGAGVLAGAGVHGSRPPAIPIMALSPLVYPAAGLVWGGLLHQAATQGYLAWLGVNNDLGPANLHL
jgi:hypothetical protein